ncbi:Acg family FMN-binding oxidoreductase [Salinibacterium sp.]|uniref:Acg family FMN-binding oxidoreductase n=1 Tax=Salinibacterium sp. TaxID=1915057 RepID=UPI00286CEEE8|nr:hypothetical protein [Salinibacterium sp.]
MKATSTNPSKISRRSLLGWTGLGLGSAIVVGAAGVTIRGATNGVFNVGDGDAYELWRQWPSMTGVDRVVGAGALACNPHNTQPWFFDIEGRRIVLSSDPSRRMPYFDPFLREHFAGLGSALENMVIAARGAGMQAEISVFPDGVASDIVAFVDLGPEEAPAVDEATFAQFISSRHTNRGPFTSRKITEEDIQALDYRAGSSEAKVSWVRDEKQISSFGALLVEATESIVSDENQSVESFGWFRLERGDVERERDGVTLDCQGIDPATLFAAKIFPPLSRKDGDGVWLSSTRDVHTATAAAYGVVIVPDSADHAAQLAGGRLLARLHLAATERGLAFHHMNQITERIDHDLSTGSPDIFSDRWADVIGTPARNGLVSFRIGYPDRKPGLSPRRALDDFVADQGV